MSRTKKLKAFCPALEWTMTGVASMAATAVTVKATPQAGSSSSQPLFISRAWVTVAERNLCSDA
ncbi:MAG: hypothetical protein LBG96_00790 [Tannerella sp.]|nr:hypothetical protein [Tannerella sp.]